MKRFFMILLTFIISFSFVGCKKKDNLNELSSDLTNYEININLNADTKTLSATQNVDYINSTNSIIKEVKLS